MSGWPAALVLAVLIVCSSFLAWKGTIPSHAFFMVAGAAITWAVPKAAQLLSSRARASSSFPPEEIPTKKERDVITQAMPKFEKDKKGT